ncbi:turripeptide Gsg9.2 [Drosophila biarmipes]|uniref:turripeptide Gsg9.2 n=1 Tax=Drosophila biarmipes TaxID=125945 RepID=UPI0007E5BEC6|nr:turripeptide Gsg9.2 [Drosophila biarmipes]
MKCVVILLIVSLGLLALAHADSGKTRCPRACTRDYRPVCAELRRGIIRPIISRCTFSNRCGLDNQRCRTNQNWVIVDERRKCWRESPDCDELRKQAEL